MSDVPERFGFPVVSLPAAAASPEAVVEFLARQLVQSGKLAPEHLEQLVADVLHRENLGSTNLGRGLAIPHSKSAGVNNVLGIIGESAQGMRWPGRTGAVPVRVVCLLVAPANKPGSDLRALEALSRRLRGQ